MPEQAKRVSALLRAAPGRSLTFGELVADCANGLEVVASFLGLLELYRERAVAFTQPEALGLLTVAWTGEADEAELEKAIEEAEDYQ